MGGDDQADGEASRKSNPITTTDALTSKDHACTTEKHCADDGNKKRRRIIIKLPKKREEDTSEVNKKLDQDMGFHGHAEGEASRNSNLASCTDALTSKERACTTEKHCAGSDDNGNKRRRRLIKFSERRKEVTSEVNKTLDQDRGCDGHVDGKTSRERPLSTSTDALTIKERACTIETHSAPLDDNGDKRALSERPKQVTTEAKKKLDQDMVKKLDKDVVQTKLEASARKLESRYQQIRENKRKIKVLDVKDLPPPK